MIEKSQKLSMLLFLPQPPTKSSLIKDMLRYGVLNNSIPPLTDLYEVLETQFNPLDLCTQVQNCLNNLKTFADHDYIGQYIEPVQDVAMCRLIKQISQVRKEWVGLDKERRYSFSSLCFFFLGLSKH